MHANKREELDKVYSGDIAAAIGFKFTTTGDTICDEQHPVILESMEFPEPVIELAIEPKTKASQGKLGESLAKLAEEDPTFRAHTDQETGQTIIAGMGELKIRKAKIDLENIRLAQENTRKNLETQYINATNDLMSLYCSTPGSRDSLPYC